MNIAITNPTTWPRVRRGTERFINELAFDLAERGHQVTVIATRPGPKEVLHERGYKTVLYRSLWHPSLARAGILEFHPFLFTAMGSLLRHRYDLHVCCTFMDAFAANCVRNITGVPFVFWVNGLPTPIRYVRSLTLRGQVFRHAIQKADEVIALSTYMQNYLLEHFGRGGIRVPVPVDTNLFRLCRQRDQTRPVVLCSAALEDARKGGRLLMRAFNRLKAIRQNVILQLSCGISQAKREELLALVEDRWREDALFLGAGRLEDLPELFGRAAVSVLPSRWEPFGLVTLESMATGTPVVATRDGGIPEIVTTDHVGRLFDPGPETSPEPTNLKGLVEALEEGLWLSRQPDTAQRCRHRAEEFSWKKLGPLFEQLFQQQIHPNRGDCAA